MLDNLSKYHIMLASKSPRRRELLKQLRIPFTVITINGIEEKYPDNLPKEEVAAYLSEHKADSYFSLIKGNELLITADTIVLSEDKIYGKPADNDEAKRMLEELSGRTHKVITGVTIMTSDKKTTFSVTTDVKFSHLDKADINYYVDNFSPTDKAGAYGIQEWIGCVGVEYISGSFYNVMGLPVHRLYNELRYF